MAKRIRSEQLVVRIAGPLRQELEAKAAAAERVLSDYVRRVLIQHVVDTTEHRA
jgi:predicted HicB family RNase H-like nuclease